MVSHGSSLAGSFQYATLVAAEGTRVSGFKIGDDANTNFHFCSEFKKLTLYVSGRRLPIFFQKIVLFWRQLDMISSLIRCTLRERRISK